MINNDIPTARTLKPDRVLETARQHPLATGVGALMAALAVTALVNDRLAKRAELDNSPAGRFVEVDGVRLHYLERGKGDPLVLLHGAGGLIQDFESSGLLDLASKKYRTIIFDRPGYGHSRRPRGRLWTAVAQADLLQRALTKIGASRAVILGHSWGASVAVAMGLRHPHDVRALVLASGYYYPSARADVIAHSGPAVPILGDMLRHTVSPWVSRAMWSTALRKMFAPAQVPSKFHTFPREMTFRPSQLRASAEESAMMIPGAFAAQEHYAELKMPVVIIAGQDDRIVDVEDQSARLHRAISRSVLHRLPNVGHMVHQSAPDRVLAAIDQAAELAGTSKSAAVAASVA